MAATEKRTRTAWLQVATVFVLAAVSLPWLVHPWFEARNDASIYVLVTQALLSGEGYTLLGEPFAVRPPGFVLFLCPWIAAVGARFDVLNLVVASTGVIAVTLLFAWARRRVGPWVAAGVSAALWFNPLFRELSNQVMSDVPGLALILGSLLLAESDACRVSTRRQWALGALIGVSTLVRTAGLFVLVGLWAARLTKGHRALPFPALLRVSAAVLVVLAPWAIRNRAVTLPVPAEQTHLHSYASGMFHEDKGDPRSPRLEWSDIAARVPGQLERTVTSIGSRFRDGADGPLAIGVGTLALVLALVVLAWRREAAEWMLLALLALVSVYFAFMPRLVLPLFVLSLVASAEVLQRGLSRALGARASLVVVALLAFTLAALDAIDGARDGERWRRRTESMESLATALEERFPPGTALATGVGWELGVHLEGHRVYSLLMAAQRGGVPALHALLERHAIQAVVLRRDSNDGKSLARGVRPVLSEREAFGDWVILSRP